MGGRQDGRQQAGRRVGAPRSTTRTGFTHERISPASAPPVESSYPVRVVPRSDARHPAASPASRSPKVYSFCFHLIPRSFWSAPPPRCGAVTRWSPLCLARWVPNWACGHIKTAIPPAERVAGWFMVVHRATPCRLHYPVQPPAPRVQARCQVTRLQHHAIAVPCRILHEAQSRPLQVPRLRLLPRTDPGVDRGFLVAPRITLARQGQHVPTGVSPMPTPRERVHGLKPAFLVPPAQRSHVDPPHPGDIRGAANLWQPAKPAHTYPIGAICAAFTVAASTSLPQSGPAPRRASQPGQMGGIRYARPGAAVVTGPRRVKRGQTGQEQLRVGVLAVGHIPCRPVERIVGEPVAGGLMV